MREEGGRGRGREGGRGGRGRGGGGGGEEDYSVCLSLNLFSPLPPALCSHTGRGENRIEVEEVMGGREELTLGEGWRHSLCLTRSTTSLSLLP